VYHLALTYEQGRRRHPPKVQDNHISVSSVGRLPDFGAFNPHATPSAGPACRVRRATSDHPSRFSGHDKRAPSARGIPFDDPSHFSGHDRHAPRAGVTSTSLRFAERGIPGHLSQAWETGTRPSEAGRPISPLSSSPAKPAPVVCQNEDFVGEIPGSTTLTDNNEQISCRRIDVHNKRNYPREGTRLSGPRNTV